MFRISISILYMTALWNVLCFAAPGSLVRKIDFGSCTGPDSEPGLCLRLGDCKHLYDLLLSDKINERIQFLANSQCGLDTTQTKLDRKVLVCCPNKFDSEPLDEVEATSGNILPRAGICGQVLYNRIYGGNETQIDEYPWLALLKYEKPNNVVDFDCAGALINNRYVLTAAHCVKNARMPSQVNITEVRLGEHNLNTAPDCVVSVNNRRDCAPLHIDVGIESIKVHEDYIPETQEQFNDIALIRLERSIPFTNFIKPICLPVAEELRLKNFKGDSMEIAGWGATRYTNQSKSKLKAAVTVWALEKCKQNYAQSGIAIIDSQLCAGGEQNIDTCRGDSGGPLMVVETIGTKKITFAAGVVSYGPRPCGTLNWPGVYTRVGAFIPWIESNLRP